MDTTNVYTSYSGGRIFFATADNMTYFIYTINWINQKYDDDGNVLSADAVYSERQDVMVDINGLNPPNTYGKDVFYFIVDFKDGVLRPYGYGRPSSEINNSCSKNGSGVYCAAKIMRDGWKINY